MTGRNHYRIISMGQNRAPGGEVLARSIQMPKRELRFGVVSGLLGCCVLLEWAELPTLFTVMLALPSRPLTYALLVSLSIV